MLKRVYICNMKFNNLYWSWIFSLAMYITALYSVPVVYSGNIGKGDKETKIVKAFLFSVKSVLNKGKSLLSPVKRTATNSDNPFLKIIGQANNVVSEIKGSHWLVVGYYTFIAKELCTERLKYFVYPFHHHW